jgi:Trm5-related predicted tRNA methylase
MTTAQKVVDRLMRELDDRKGFELGMVDDKTLREWRKQWAEIIDEEFTKAECYANGVHLFSPKCRR